MNTTMPRFAFLPKPNDISTSEDVILMRAYDFEEQCLKDKNCPESQYITNRLQGFYLYSKKDFDQMNWREPTEEEISQFAVDVINTYRMTDKARNLLSTLRDALK